MIITKQVRLRGLKKTMLVLAGVPEYNDRLQKKAPEANIISNINSDRGKAFAQKYGLKRFALGLEAFRN